ncbi:MAG: ABC transporter substrate-binding protein, partial [Saprospiraceae bacterium]
MKNYILIFIFTAAFLSCSKKESSEKIFRYNESQGIENLDPVMASNYQSIWPLQQSLEGLMEFTKDMNLVDNLAKSHSISEDALTYTFIIHNNIFFHDDDCFPDKKGRVVKAGDFKYCFERLCDPQTKTRGAWLFRDKVKGAEEYINAAKNNWNNVKEITGIQT